MGIKKYDVEFYTNLGMDKQDVIDFATDALASNSLQEFLRNDVFWNKFKHNIESPSHRSREKLNIILYGSIPQCKTCDNSVTWNHRKSKFRTYCSSRCANKDEDKKNKTRLTNLEKYGVDYPMQNNIIRMRQQQTLRNNFGVDYPMQNEALREKTKSTNLKKYGAVAPAQNKNVLEKMKLTNLKKYGVEYVSQDPTIRKKQITTLEKNYGVKVPMYNEDIKNKVRELIHKAAVDNGYPSQYHISEKSLALLGNIEFLYNQHIIEKTSLTEIANSLNVNPETVRSRMHINNIPVNRYNISMGEKSINNFIENLGIKTIQNTRSIIPPYELDIYIPSHNLAIEYCGLYWHSEQAGKDKNYHKRKYDLCKEQNIQLITIFEDEWFNRQEQVKSKIKSLLHKDARTKIFARKTQIMNVSKHSKKTFFDENHIQGSGPGSINIGLTYDNSLVACMSFIKRKNDNYELNRYATSAQVTGGFSKVLKHFINEYQPTKIISFADLRWSTGNLYTKTGWVVDKILSPDYSYSPDAKQRFHKFNYRRKNLPKLLNTFDPELSEKINCDNNGILRIWDCGKIRFTFPLDI